MNKPLETSPTAAPGLSSGEALDGADYQALARTAIQLCDVPMAVICLRQDGVLEPVASAGIDHAALGLSSSAICRGLPEATRQTVFSDITRDARFAGSPLAGGKLQLRFIALQPLQMEDGRPAGMIILLDPVPRSLNKEQSQALTDLTDLVNRLIEARRLRMKIVASRAQALVEKVQAESASRAKSDFLGRVSHELRTPLNTIIGFSQMLLLNRTGNLNDTQKEYATQIDQAGRQLLGLISDMLDLAAGESTGLKVAIRPVRVAEVLASIRDRMANAARKAEIRFDVAGWEVPDFRADPLRLQQCLENLADNAIRYNRPGGSVVISASTLPGNRVRLAVMDTGIGIPLHRQERIFQPFESLMNEGATLSGTGIGLALTSRYVEQMGGQIGFSSRPDEGSLFWIDLPQDSAPLDLLEPAPRRAVTSNATHSVLYVEDSRSNMTLMEHLLSSFTGLAMIGVETPLEGLESALKHRPDVIILDINLPGMDGYELLSRLREHPDTAAIPVIALTASALPADVQRGLEAGFFRYLTKPIDVVRFFAAMKAALEMAGEIKEARAGA